MPTIGKIGTISSNTPYFSHTVGASGSPVITCVTGAASDPGSTGAINPTGTARAAGASGTAGSPCRTRTTGALGTPGSPGMMEAT